MNATDIIEVRFSGALNGYKKDEVDSFLDRVEEDYHRADARIGAMQKEIDALKAEIEGYKTSQNTVQNVLINAQKLADQTVEDARMKANEIIAQAKLAAESATAEARVMLENIDVKLSEKKNENEREMQAAVEKMSVKQKAMEDAAADSVVRQQALFDKLRLEATAFKKELMGLYKEHLALISKIPDAVAMDSERAANAVSVMIDEQPDLQRFIPVSEPTEKAETVSVTEIFEADTEAAPQEQPTEETATAGFSNEFFSKTN